MKRDHFLCLTILCALTVGCQPPPSSEPTTSADGGAEMTGGHDHGHDDMGPHGGHLLHLEPTGAHAEWTHDDDTKLITVHLDDFDASKISGVKFVVKIADASQEFPLVKSDEGWTITSEELMTHINMGEAAVVTLLVMDEDGEQSTRIEAHEHHHH
jgi:hypothetical protein